MTDPTVLLTALAVVLLGAVEFACGMRFERRNRTTRYVLPDEYEFTPPARPKR